MGAVVSATKILRFLQSHRSPATVSQIAKELNLNLSTTFNMLCTLVDEDFVAFDPRGKSYTLSLGVVGLARGALEQSLELRTVEPLLRTFAHRHSVMACVSRRISRDRSLLVAVAESDAPIRLHGRVGTPSPLLLGAAGRIFAAYSDLSESEMLERFTRLHLARSLDFDTFKTQVAEARQTGWAIDDGFYYPGTISVAAPVFDRDRGVTLVCSAIMLNGQFDPKRVTTVARELMELALSAGAPSPDSQPQPEAVPPTEDIGQPVAERALRKPRSQTRSKQPA